MRVTTFGRCNQSKLVAVLLACALGIACHSRLSHVEAVIRNAGSDTMVNVAQAWAEEYAKVRPSISVEVSGGGSATGICGSRKFSNIISGDVCRCRDFPISGFAWGFDCSLPGL